MPTVRRTAVVVETGVFRYHGRENAFVDVSGGEISGSEVTRLIGIVEFQLQGLGESVIYLICEAIHRMMRHGATVPSLFPAEIYAP